MKKAVEGAVGLIHLVSKAFSWLGGVALFVMCLLTFVDVFMRYFFKSPITGSQEIVAMMLVLATYGGLPCGVMQKMLVESDVITKNFPEKLQAALQFFMSLVCTVVCALMASRVFTQTVFYFDNTNLTTAILKIRYGPFYAIACVGCVMIGLELLIHTVNYFIAVIAPGRKANGHE